MRTNPTKLGTTFQNDPSSAVQPYGRTVQGRNAGAFHLLDSVVRDDRDASRLGDPRERCEYARSVVSQSTLLTASRRPTCVFDRRQRVDHCRSARCSKAAVRPAIRWPRMYAVQRATSGLDGCRIGAAIEENARVSLIILTGCRQIDARFARVRGWGTAQDPIR